MAKTEGLGDQAYVAGFDLSGNILSVGRLSGGPATLDVTPLNSLAYQRLGGLRDGAFEFVTAMDPAAGAEHAALSTLPTADVIMTYFNNPALGSPAASLNAKQVNYDPARDQAGMLTFAVQGVGNSFGLEWGLQLTPGIRTDTTATAAGPSNSIDTLASASFGGQAYLQVFSVTGTSVTVAIWDSADNITFAAVAGFAFTAATPGGSPQAQRISISNVSTIRRYIAAATTGTFTNAQFAVQVVKNPIAGVVF